MEDKESITIRKAVINQAINYIFEHIDEDITVEDVAKYCSYSKYHLTRMFKEDTDEALYQFIKRVRLERSAWRLKVEKERSITEIGETYGYSSSNFATAFKKHLDISPADYRRSSEQMVEDRLAWSCCCICMHGFWTVGIMSVDQKKKTFKGGF